MEARAELAGKGVLASDLSVFGFFQDYTIVIAIARILVIIRAIIVAYISIIYYICG